MKQEERKYILENAGKMSVQDIARDLGIKEKKVRKFLDSQENQKSHSASTDKTKALPSKATLIAIGLIVLLGFVIYANSLDGEFLWDDYHLVKNNTYIRDWSSVLNIFTQHVGAGASRMYHFYRPVQIFSYALDYSLWGSNVIGYHLTNVILHILVALSLYWLITILFGDRRLSLITSLFFIAHPIHTEAISYISGRPDPLAALFLLLTLIFYIKDLGEKKTLYLVLGAFSYSLALLSREASLILPLLLLLYHAAFKRRISVRSIILPITLACGYVIVRMSILKSILPEDVGDATALHRLPGTFMAVTNYMRILFMPLNLHMGYGRKLFFWNNFGVIIGVVIIIAMIALAIRKRKSSNLIFFSIAWFSVTLLPYCNIIYPLNAYMAEHWLYLPSIGFFLLAAKAICVLSDKKAFKPFVIGLTVLILMFHSFLTVRQNGFWRDPYKFYKMTLKYVKDSGEVYNNLGVIYGRRGDYKEAIRLFEKSIETDPDYRDPHFNLGKAYNEIGKKREAVIYYRKAIDIDPKLVTAEAYYNLANIYNELEKYNEAIELYKKSLEVEPGLVHAYNNLGLAYFHLGDNETSVGYLKKAIALDPRDPYAYINLAAVYLEEKKYGDAIRYFDKAGELGLDNPVLSEALKPYRARSGE